MNGAVQLFHRVRYAVVNGNDGIAAAEIFRQLLGQVLGQFGIIAAGHIDQQDLMRAEDISEEGSRYCRVNAAGSAQYHPFDSCLFQEVLRSVTDYPVKNRSFVIFCRNQLIFCRVSTDFFGFPVQGKNQQLFFQHGRSRFYLAVRPVDTALPVKGIDAFSGVLDTDGVAVNKRRP